MAKDTSRIIKKWHCVTSYDHITPKESGCYAIYKYNLDTKKSQLLYIGTAQNLYIRLKKHPVVRVLRSLLEGSEIPMVKCKIITDKKLRLKTEQTLIARLRPKVNCE